MMFVVEDTRQKADKHTTKHSRFDEMGVQVIRCKLPFGDYSLPPSISVDTKENMNEIAENLTNDHARFRRECELARDAGCQLYILVETEWDIHSIEDVNTWINPRGPLSQKAVNGDKLQKIMLTMSHRYGVKFVFCHPLESAEMVIKILKGEYE